MSIMSGTLTAKLGSIIGQLALALAVGYALLVLLIYLLQARLLYLPHVPGRALTATPADIGLPYEQVTLTASDGVTLTGWFVPASGEPVAELLFFHGNAGNISHRLDSLRIFHDIGLSTLIIDYRGYGASAGKPTEQGTYLDAEVAWSYLLEQRNVPPAKIVISGRSLGAAVAARLATGHRAAALILESPFRSIPDLAAELYPLLPARRLARFRYDTETYVRSVDAPVLVIHGRDDEIINVEHGRQVHAAADPPREFMELRGGHNDAFLIDRERYVDGLLRFIGKHTAAVPSAE